LVISKHVEPDNILCLTFTNKAAREMKSRIGEWLGACDLSQVCTFHSFCYRIVTENADLLHFSDSFVLLDTDDKNSLIEEICERIGIDTSEKGYSVLKIRRYIDGFKSGISRRRYLDLLFGPSDEAVDCAIKSSSTQLDEICYRFLYEQRTSALLEFDDLIHAVSYLFYTNPQVMSWWQNRIKYVMVDEYQDVNGFQAQMCKCLSAVNKNLFVVGDPNQTIYSWRFADVKYINQFVAESKEKDIVLVDNYRSTPEILSVARNLIRKQSKYSFVARNPSGERPVFYQAKTRSEEAAWIVNTMNWIVRQGVPRNEVAVLYRNSSSSSRIEYELLKRKLPYIVIGGNSFYSSNDIKVIIAYLQLIVYDNDFAFKKVIGKPSRGIGGKTLAKLFGIQVERNCSLFEALSISLSESIPNVFSTSTSVKKARDFVAFVETIRKELETSSISKIVSDIIELSGYASFLSENEDDDGLRNIIEFLSTVQNIESENANAGITNYSVQDFLKETATYTSSDNSEKTNSFVLSTVHGAKGLEYQYVILSGMEESSFPSDFKYRNGTITTEIEHIQEERRLCFVALTRATKGVFVTNASTVNNDGPNDRLIPSRFINEMQK
jgi:DNA helicase-2/ATP-dependent DNA helicase PcrA